MLPDCCNQAASELLEVVVTDAFEEHEVTKVNTIKTANAQSRAE
jgi:hypothetical protein